jgi:putative ATP-dependent endonuclease of OLD family
MEYHGMGTRSWSSLLTLKSFVTQFSESLEALGEPFYPLVAIEEPEAHLHPNAQKKLYSQIASIPGQKIISTHSTYIAASANLNEIRNLYKNNEEVKCGKIDVDILTPENIRKINRQVINTRGELFFSKVVVFFEGETEEQALPIFAEKHFGKSFSELGIDFVGVGGFGSYHTFIKFAEAFNIPYLVFSDAEEGPRESVIEQINNSNNKDISKVIFVDDGNDFEKQLVVDGYQDEIRMSIEKIDLPEGSHPNHIAAKKAEILAYDDAKLYAVMTASKTQFAPVLAQSIIESNKDLPIKVVQLFEEINKIINPLQND